MARRCDATSKRTGEPCGQYVPPGATVCRWHGGEAPQTRAAAARRMQELVDPMIAHLRAALAEGGRIGNGAARVIATVLFGSNSVLAMSDDETDDEILAVMTPAEQTEILVDELVRLSDGRLDRDLVAAAIGPPPAGREEWQQRDAAEAQADRRSWLLDRRPHDVVELDERPEPVHPEGDDAAAGLQDPAPWVPPADWRQRLRGQDPEPPDESEEDIA